MKKQYNILMFCVVGLALSACAEGLGDFDTAPPYDTERTATHAQHTPPPEPQPEPAPIVREAPMCKPCEDCGPFKSRVATLESELAACREASNRVRDAYSQELKK
ncbi:MAG: hypothetical protein AB8B83_05190 [Bdellovibrionales bacterium]